MRRRLYRVPRDLMRWVTCLFCLGAIGSTSQSLHAEDTGSATGADSAQMALACFASYHSREGASFDPTELRRRAYESLADRLRCRGYLVPTFGDMEAHLRKWRIRSDQSLAPGFLEAVGTGSGAEQLLVAHFALYEDRVVLMARCLRTDSGALNWVDVEERRVDLGSDKAASASATGWTEAIDKATQGLMMEWADRSPPPGASKLVVLPTRASGIEGMVARVTTHLLLGELLRTGSWLMVDPGVIVWFLRSEGIESYPLTASGRAGLELQFGSATALESQLTTYETSVVSRVGFESDDGPIRFTLGTRDPMHLSVFELDLKSGLVLTGQGAYVEEESLTGLFGSRRYLSMHRRLEKAVDRIVRASFTGGAARQSAALRQSAK